MAELTMREMLEAGVHFGHQTNRWNPKMKKYIFGARNGIYIIDLQQTVKMFREVYGQVRDLAGQGGQILFVGTKKQAAEAIADAGIEPDAVLDEVRASDSPDAADFLARFDDFLFEHGADFYRQEILVLRRHVAGRDEAEKAQN